MIRSKKYWFWIFVWFWVLLVIKSSPKSHTYPKLSHPPHLPSPSTDGDSRSPDPIFSGLYSFHIPSNTWTLLQDDGSALRSRIGHSMLFHPVSSSLYLSLTLTLSLSLSLSPSMLFHRVSDWLCRHHHRMMMLLVPLTTKYDMCVYCITGYYRLHFHVAYFCLS